MSVAPNYHGVRSVPQLNGRCAERAHPRRGNAGGTSTAPTRSLREDTAAMALKPSTRPLSTRATDDTPDQPSEPRHISECIADVLRELTGDD